MTTISPVLMQSYRKFSSSGAPSLSSPCADLCYYFSMQYQTYISSVLVALEMVLN